MLISDAVEKCRAGARCLCGLLILSCGAITFVLVDKMITGKQRPLLFQYMCSAALATILSSTSTPMSAMGRGALEVVLQRVAVTTVAVLLPAPAFRQRCRGS